MPAAEGAPRTLYDKVFQDHIVDERLDGTILLYIGMLLILVWLEQGWGARYAVY
jgi:3-isopropylmalate dehydratase